jgi:YkoY family integral membrane protein
MDFLFGSSPLIALPTVADILGALPVILSLIVIEGLLSVDNALAIAAMARHLPKPQQLLALRLGIIGAYLFRGLCMALAAWIVENPWLKIGGAVYLIYLMCKHFTEADEVSDGSVPDVNASRGFLGTVVAIELMDLSLSVDNVVAAVAMSPKLWVVCTGVFIGILALRFVAGACLKLIERYPILEETAFLLIGYVGFILVFELITEPGSGLQILEGPVHVSALQKFVGIVLILALSVAYSRVPILERTMSPVLRLCRVPMKWVSRLVGIALKVLVWPFAVVFGLFKRSRTSM